ncbi:sugar phosphate isomerase/epimerase family protein [Algoriphagus zhangzhouensis]|uniref:Sugar phosphate isomerase/epimerase n=1 Tax=Algoriphagus zhangzhouensis TaxID=1073327 RepID=A0A1M7ZJ14_9BACT|nr:sugar phosphate isomerase/epimerase [Algoriphagus zhangzhouensis]TDY43654.1 sugar phosphate isomerase/epimerase [Algoriphagus zhangzhouensis]SHO64868.1 Sugar phosphate isomerase/epimerase [Algoriphagus zhangzhouensis]
MNKQYFSLILLLSFLFLFPKENQAQKKGDPLFQVPLGIASYTFRNHWENGVEPTLDIIQKMGFKEFEGGAPKGVSPEEFKKMLNNRGISIPSTGTGFEQLESDPQAVADRAKALGAKYVMCAWIPHNRGAFSKENADRAIKAFNEGGKVLKENGIIFKYHVHGYEFQPYEDGTLFDYMVENTDPKYVSLQMDVMWTHFGGGDPAGLLEKYGDRWVSLHLKDFRKGAPKDMTGLTGPENDVPLGQGELDFPAILKAANKIGIKHMFIEDEGDHEIEALPKSIAYLKSLKY